MSTELTPEQLHRFQAVIKNWLPEMTASMRGLIGSYVMYDSKQTAFLTQLYLQRVKAIVPWVLKETDLLMNGFLYYVANVMFAYCHYATLERIHGKDVCLIVEARILRMSLACVIVDFMLDTTADKAAMKKQMVGLVGTIIAGNGFNSQQQKTTDPRLLSGFTLLQEVLQAVPEAIPCVLRCFHAEMASTKQTEGKLNYKELLAIERLKGGLTYEMIGCCIGDGKSLDVPHDLGYAVQLYDDLADMYIDQREGTWTLVWSEIARCGSVDRILLELVETIDRLPATYWPFKIGLSFCVAAIACSNPYVSKEVTTLMAPYFPLPSRGKDEGELPVYRNAIYDHLAYNVAQLP
ncbi:Hypothetical protein POVN_LOCUS322 [uncultured virus]|nr:Hypothetical protein POVN_LOCUS322 [uncultured virus]